MTLPRDNRAAVLETVTRELEIQSTSVWPSMPVRADDIHWPYGLFLDGLNSNSDAASNWIRSFASMCPVAFDPVAEEPSAPISSGERVPIHGFSYSSPGSVYSRVDTWQSLALGTRIFDKHVSRMAPFVIPIGFSLGSNIALLGTERVTQSQSRRIPAVILIAPAHTPNRALLSDYIEYARKAQHPPAERSTSPASPVSMAIPSVVRELCDADPRWREQIAESYHLLTERGIHIHILSSRADQFVPLQLPQLPARLTDFVHHEFLSSNADRRPRGSGATDARLVRREVLHHLGLRVNDETLGKVCEIVRRYCEPTTIPSCRG